MCYNTTTCHVQEIGCAANRTSILSFQLDEGIAKTLQSKGKRLYVYSGAFILFQLRITKAQMILSARERLSGEQKKNTSSAY